MPRQIVQPRAAASTGTSSCASHLSDCRLKPKYSVMWSACDRVITCAAQPYACDPQVPAEHELSAIVTTCGSCRTGAGAGVVERLAWRASPMQKKTTRPHAAACWRRTRHRRPDPVVIDNWRHLTVAVPAWWTPTNSLERNVKCGVNGRSKSEEQSRVQLPVWLPVGTRNRAKPWEFRTSALGSGPRGRRFKSSRPDQ